MNSMIKISKIVFIGLLVCSCNAMTETSQEVSPKNYREFHEWVKGKEYWLIDTLFAGISGAALRYEHGCVLDYDHAEDSMGVVVVFNNNGKLDVRHKYYDSTRTTFNNIKFAHALDIINLCEEYKIYHISIGHKARSLSLQFFGNGDTSVSMVYADTPTEFEFKHDMSFTAKKGWFTYIRDSTGKERRVEDVEILRGFYDTDSGKYYYLDSCEERILNGKRR